MFAYFDETVGGANGLTAVAGYLFDSEGKANFQRLYQSNVEPLLPADRQGRRLFRASQLLAGQPPFAIPQPQRSRIFALMADAIKESVRMGAVVGIEKDEYDRGLLGRIMRVRSSKYAGNGLEPLVGSSYSLCLVKCIQAINDWLDKEKVSGSIQYVVESGCQGEEEAADILSRIERATALKNRFRWGRCSFVRKGPEVPWLFAADYLAWEWQRYDLLAAHPDRGEWRTIILPLIEGRPHVAAYLTEQSVNTQALINAANGLTPLDKPSPGTAGVSSSRRSD